ncbi:EAL domain-containing protein [Escherichia albertii]|nr:EAL domain-containing protein [Escherichia albertii]MCZ9195563.1 EAL domain-containing protein [Escherichia albertii]MCZ9222643.1 EAL domain-containing protein [Escherichia albertii]
MTNIIKKAIADDVFVPYFQPIVCMEERTCVGCETLIRWDRPVPGITSTEQLIAEAVDHGIIFQLTEIMMEKTASILGAVKSKLPSDFYISINVTPSCILDVQFEDACSKFIRHFEDENIKLVVELTEQYPLLVTDKTFVHHIHDDNISKYIIDSISSLADKLDMRVIAEGVENERDAFYLYGKGISYMQGYYFSRALCGNEFIDWWLK